MTAVAVVKALGGRRGLARCPAHDDHTPSLSVTDAPDGRLLTHCFSGCDPEAVWDALKRKGLVRSNDDVLGPAPRRPQPDNSAHALEIWRASRPAAGTAVEAYLRSRGITIPVPLSIQYHPALKHGPTGLIFEALVAGVCGLDRRIVAIHRIFLLPGGYGKAKVSQPKMSLGPVAGGAVRLAPTGKALGLAEGIETALSAQQLFDIPVWAALGSRLDRVTVPEDVVEVQIFGDNGRAGQEAAEKAADALTRAGKRVCLRYPPGHLPDWNDALQTEDAP